VNAHPLSRHGYADPSRPTRTARDVEHDLLAQSSRRIQSAASRGPAAFAELAAALHENRRIWDALASDIAGPDNRLPASLRAGLFYLAEFTRVHSRKVLDGKATPDALLDVNRAVMRGLRPGAGAP